MDVTANDVRLMALRSIRGHYSPELMWQFECPVCGFNSGAYGYSWRPVDVAEDHLKTHSYSELKPALIEMAMKCESC